jgi:hypothetical protein
VYDYCKGQKPRLVRFEMHTANVEIGKKQECSCAVDVGPKPKQQTFEFGPVDQKPN